MAPPHCSACSTPAGRSRARLEEQGQAEDDDPEVGYQKMEELPIGCRHTIRIFGWLARVRQ